MVKDKGFFGNLTGQKSNQDDVLEYLQMLRSAVDSAKKRQEVTWIHSIQTMKHDVSTNTHVKQVALSYHT